MNLRPKLSLICDDMATPSQDLVRCSTCKELKPIADILPSSFKRKSGWRQCKNCCSTAARSYKARNLEKVRAANRAGRKLRYPEDKRRREAMLESMSVEDAKAFRAKGVLATTQSNARLKNEVFVAYGGAKCACCGETEKLFLTIDHMLNNASELRRNGVHKLGGAPFYRWLKKSGYPKEYQVLCMNCNFGKRLANGVCPHKVRCNDHSVREVGPSGPKLVASA